MLHVAIFLAVGFPILSMLVLRGGVDPRLVLLGVARSPRQPRFSWPRWQRWSRSTPGASAKRSSSPTRSSFSGCFCRSCSTTVSGRVGVVGDVSEWGQWVAARLEPELGREVVPVRAGDGDVEPHRRPALDWPGSRPRPAAHGRIRGLAASAVVSETAGGGTAVRSPRGRPRGGWFRLRARPVLNRPTRWTGRSGFTSRETLAARVVGGLLTLAIAAPLVYATIYFARPALDELVTYVSADRAPGPLTRSGSSSPVSSSSSCRSCSS